MVVHVVNTITISLVSAVFGALITYFFKTVAQNKRIQEEIKMLLKEGFDIHTKIHHKNSYSEAIEVSRHDTDCKLSEYKKEVDFKFNLLDKKLDTVFSHIESTNQSINNININIARIYGNTKPTEPEGPTK